jgi:tetratricopeptide (TPR) repeat protein
MCWSHSRLETDKQEALSAVDEGMARYPDSALLMVDKGGLLEMFGDATAARALYERAEKVAADNLRRNPQSRNDRYVLRRLGKPGPPSSAAPFETTMTTSAPDLGDARPVWQQRAWKFMAVDNCKGAVEYLKANPMLDNAWYALYSQADALCWQEGLGEPYREHALAILDAGLRLQSNSPRLLKSKADYYQLVGDKAHAAHFRQMASLEANKLISSGEGALKDEAEQVGNELRLETGTRP